MSTPPSLNAKPKGYRIPGNSSNLTSVHLGFLMAITSMTVAYAIVLPFTTPTTDDPTASYKLAFRRRHLRILVPLLFAFLMVASSRLSYELGMRDGTNEQVVKVTWARKSMEAELEREREKSAKAGEAVFKELFG